MEFKDPLTPLDQIPIKYRGAFGRWRKIKQTPLADRFWPYVDRRGPNECWPFIGNDTIKHGYGIVTLSAKPRVRWLAHRLAWVVTNGDIADGLFVCHRCDNPPCCNPAHLFVGTQKDNMSDCASKGRLNPQKGEQHKDAVLTEAQVIQIRSMYKPHVVSQAMLGKMFGASKGAIAKIVTHQSWTHI